MPPGNVTNDPGAGRSACADTVAMTMRTVAPIVVLLAVALLLGWLTALATTG